MPAAYVYIYVRALAGEVYGDEAHAYVLVEARGTTPAGDLTGRLAIVEDGLAVPGDASGVHGETDEPTIGSLFLDLEQDLLAGEGARCEVHETSESGFEGVYGGVHVVAVESEGGFEAEAVSGDEAAGFDTRGPEAVPQRNSGVGVYDDFYPVLTGVAGVGDEGIRSWDGDGEEGRVVGVEGEEGLDDGGGARALDGDHGRLLSAVDHAGVGEVGELIHQCLNDYVPVGGVANDEDALIREPVDDEVVENAAVLIAGHAVAGVAGWDGGDVSGDNGVGEGLSVGTIEEEPAHVGDVEHSGVGANGMVFPDGGAVTGRHVPAAELDHLGV